MTRVSVAEGMSKDGCLPRGEGNSSESFAAHLEVSCAKSVTSHGSTRLTSTGSHTARAGPRDTRVSAFLRFTVLSDLGGTDDPS